jgi:hypothetical protein
MFHVETLDETASNNGKTAADAAASVGRLASSDVSFSTTVCPIFMYNIPLESSKRVHLPTQRSAYEVKYSESYGQNTTATQICP